MIRILVPELAFLLRYNISLPPIFSLFLESVQSYIQQGQRVYSHSSNYISSSL